MGDQNVLTVNGLYKNIKSVCKFVAEGARNAGFNEDDTFRIELACDEACTNIIEHAYGGENKGSIRAEWSATPSYFVILLHDNGRSFNPSKIPNPPEKPQNIDDLKIGGLGLHFIKKIMDDVAFTFGESGNTLTMKKKR
ncbi:MAG: ATP-binding protein [Chloroflexota bacterium]